VSLLVKIFVKIGEHLKKLQARGWQQTKRFSLCIYESIYKVAQNKIPHQIIFNISATSGLILKILEAV